jgi:LysR family glycine cleavage system transcriptional activator
VTKTTRKALPPIHALRAFEAAGRLGSFSRAAEELFVTPAAISHQVRALEEFFGVELFRRTTRRVTLTEEGRLALTYFRDGFEQLGRGIDYLRQRDARHTLTISTTPSFAAKWLLPRLDQFSRAYPDLDIRLSASTRLADFHLEPFDAAIRFGAGRYADLKSDRLFGEFLSPMASPKLIQRRVRTPADLMDLPLLHDDSVQMTGVQPGWREWFATAGILKSAPVRGPHFDDGNLLLQAAVAGRGVALGRCVLAASELESGSLVMPFGQTLALNVGYWLVYPPGRIEREAFIAFRDWLLKEAVHFAKRLPYQTAATTPRSKGTRKKV